MHKQLVQRYYKVSIGRELISTTHFLEIDNWELMDLFIFCSKISLAKKIIGLGNTPITRDSSGLLFDKLELNTSPNISSKILERGIRIFILPLRRTFETYGKIYVSRFLEIKTWIGDLTSLPTIIVINDKIIFPK